MEVHSHTHTPRKKWTHYLWEFIMLFLAVFCGFMAENFREHTVEHRREKQYMVSLVSDMVLDIESLKQSSASRKQLINYYDSLVLLLEHRDKNNMNDIYFYARPLFRMTPFSYHDRTIVQLKSSGGLRLVRNKKVADSITIYDNEIIKRMLYQQELELQLRNEIFANHIGKIFNAYVWNKMITGEFVTLRPKDNPALITDNQTVINDFALQVVTLKTAYRVTIRFIESTIRLAESLIAYVKKEYHLN